jgi:hypothetical protein
MESEANPHETICKDLALNIDSCEKTLGNPERFLFASKPVAVGHTAQTC